MFSDYDKILLDVESVEDVAFTLNNINKNAIVLYNHSDRQTPKYLFRKGVENINFVCENNLSIIRVGKPDLVITTRPIKSDYNKICEKNGVTIFSVTSKDAICGKCKRIANYGGLAKLNKICSERCALGDHPGFYEMLTSYKTRGTASTIEKSFSDPSLDTTEFGNMEMTPNEIRKIEKQHKLAILEAKRYSYQQKKAEYIRSMRMRSRSNSKTEPVFDDDVITELTPNSSKKPTMCKAKTKKEGKMCSNKALVGSGYCGIVSHRKMDPNPNNHKKKMSSNKKFEKMLRKHKNNRR